jgi:hypothetical protein
VWGTFHVLDRALSGRKMMKACYKSIWANIGDWMEYPCDVVCGGVGVILMFVAFVSTIYQFHYAAVSFEGNCTKVAYIVKIGLLAIKVLTTVVFVIYQSLLLGGSFIASTACQQAIDNTTIPQFNRELYLLEIINIFLLIDQPILYFTTGASWSFVLLFFYYFLVLCVTNEVHSRLKKEVTTPTDGIRRGQPQEQWSTQ